MKYGGLLARDSSQTKIQTDLAVSHSKRKRKREIMLDNDPDIVQLSPRKKRKIITIQNYPLHDIRHENYNENDSKHGENMDGDDNESGDEENETLWDNEKQREHEEDDDEIDEMTDGDDEEQLPDQISIQTKSQNVQNRHNTKCGVSFRNKMKQKNRMDVDDDETTKESKSNTKKNKRSYCQ